MQRRKFLQLSAVASTLAYTNLQASTAMPQKGLSANKFGVFWVESSEDKITNITPFRSHIHTNKLNEIIPEIIQKNKTRVKHPYVRKSFLDDPANPKPELRGKEEFVRVSWEVALDLTAQRLKHTYDTYGANAVYGQVYQWGNLGKVGHSRNIGKRMLNVLGGYVSEAGGYSYGCAQVIMPHVLGVMETRQHPTSWKAIQENAKNIVFWGTDPIVSNELGIGAPLHDAYENYRIIKDMAARGEMKIYSIDVFKNESAKFFNAKTLLLRPSTDTAMMIGMCHYLYTNNLHDKKFLENNCVGFDKFKEYFMGEKDGVVKDIAWASEICGIAKDEIESFIKTIAKDRTMIVSGYAIQRADHGEQAYWMLIVLNAMLGQMGRAGGGFITNDQTHKTGDTHYKAPKIRNFDVLPHDEKYKAMINPKGSVIPNSRLIECLERPGGEIERNGKVHKFPELKLMFSTNGSLFTRHQDSNRAAKALRKLDTIITLEPFWTSQAKFSDIVLPVAIQPERADIEFANSTNEYLFAIKPLVKPYGESKSDFWICNEICRRFNLDLAFNEGKDEMGWIKELYSDASKKASDMGYDMPSFEEFWQRGYFHFDKIDEAKSNHTSYVAFRNDPLNNKLNTPSGKIEIYSQTIADMGYDDCFGHPAWFEPIEWLGDKDKKYPLALVSAHSKYRLHSQLDNSEILRSYSKIAGKEPVIISPNLAKQRGIKHGDIVKVFNDRGAILCGADVSDDIPDDVIIIREGAWWDPQDDGMCHSGNVNVLTMDKGCSKLSQSNIAHTCLADIVKYDGVSENGAYGGA